MELKEAKNRALKRWWFEQKARKEEYLQGLKLCQGKDCSSLFNVYNPYRDDRDNLCATCRLSDIMELVYGDKED